MSQTLVQQIDIDSERQPVIAGISVSVEKILGKLAAGYFLGDIMESCGFSTDRPTLAAVAYAESLPLKHPIVISLLKTESGWNAPAQHSTAQERALDLLLASQ